MENKINQLEKELKYLTKEIREEEIRNNQNRLENESARVIANSIYLKRGLDITKLKRNITSNLISDLGTIFSEFKTKDKNTKKNIIIDVIYFILLIILIKIPFNLVRDVGYEYIELLTTSNTLYTIWNIVFLILYTVTLICTTLVLLKSFNNKYLNQK